MPASVLWCQNINPATSSSMVGCRYSPLYMYLIWSENVLKTHQETLTEPKLQKTQFECQVWALNI